MDQAGQRIPAWRRLGLKLKSEVQTGVTAPDGNGLEQGDNSHVKPSTNHNGLHENPEAPEAAAISNKSTRLGKRKPQDGPAENSGQTFKKRKDNREDVEANGTAVAATSTTEEDNTIGEQVSKPSEKSRPKGDPNYRKKKRSQHSESTHTKQDDSRRPPPIIQYSQLAPPSPSKPEEGMNLLASTETDFATLEEPPHKGAISRDKCQPIRNSSSPRLDRRKSVTFTPDTKTADGNSASHLFKKWVHDQKDISGNGVSTKETIQSNASAPIASASDLLLPNSEKHRLGASSTDLKVTPASNGRKKKDPSRYLDYLQEYHTNRANWKFSKAKQNDVIDNALNIFRIPDEFSDALLEYVKGLKGAGAIGRLESKCQNTIQEINEAESTMDDAAARQAAKDEALGERIVKERKRRRLEGDIEGLSDHPYPDGFIRRLKKRRAEALMKALGLAAPASAPASAAPQFVSRNSQKRKSRVEAVSDESNSDTTSSSSSDEVSSSSESDGDTESESESDSSDSDSSSDSASESSNNKSAGSDASSSSSEENGASEPDSGSGSGNSESESDSSSERSNE